MGGNSGDKKNMNYKDIDSLKQVVIVINEASDALKDKSRTISESSIPEALAGALGAGIGGAGSLAVLSGLGVSGLSAAGVTSGLAAVGSIVGGGVAAGLCIVAAPAVVLAAGGVGIAAHLKSKKLQEEKERLYQEAIRKHEAIIKALRDEVNADKERLDYLQGLNILLKKTIEKLKQDLGAA